ncbi:MAG: M48 family metalloprotease [Acidiferrobacterales bacterium]
MKMNLTVRASLVSITLLLGFAYAAYSHAQLDIVRLVKALKPVSEETEIEVGKGIAANLLGVAPPVDDPALQTYINQIGRWLVLHTEKPGLPWRFAVLDIDSVNAFAVPGGYVFVTRGLLLLMRDESELAGVLAHEISHVLERHALQTMRKGELMALGGDVLGAYISNQGAGELQQVINVGTEIYARGLDKKDEFAADYYGAVIAARAGYDPYGLFAVLQTLGSINPEDDAVALMFKTHPAADARTERLLPALDEQLAKYAQQPNNAERFAAVMRAHVARHHPTPPGRPAPRAAPDDGRQEAIKGLLPTFRK